MEDPMDTLYWLTTLIGVVGYLLTFYFLFVVPKSNILKKENMKDWFVIVSFVFLGVFVDVSVLIIFMSTLLIYDWILSGIYVQYHNQQTVRWYLNPPSLLITFILLCLLYMNSFMHFMFRDWLSVTIVAVMSLLPFIRDWQLNRKEFLVCRREWLEARKQQVA